MSDQEMADLKEMLLKFRSALMKERRTTCKRGTVHYRQIAQDIAEVDSVVSLIEVYLGHE